MTYRVASTLKSPVVLVGVPVPGRNNPLLITSSVQRVVYSSRTSDNFKLRISPPAPLSSAVKEYLASLLEAVGEAADRKLNLSVSVKSDGLLSPLQAMAVSAAAALRLVREFMIPLSTDEVMQLTRYTSSHVKTHLRPLIEGYIVHLVTGHPIVYRRGEGYVKLQSASLHEVRVESCWRDEEAVYSSPPLMDELILLSGRLVVEATHMIMRGDLEGFFKACRVDGYLSRIFYSTPDDGAAKIVPDIKGYLALRVMRRKP